MENTKSPKSPAPKSVTRVIDVHGAYSGKWRPGTAQPAMLRAIAAANNCTVAESPDRAVGRDGNTRDYGRMYAIIGGARNVDHVARTYIDAWNETYSVARRSFLSNDPELNPDSVEWSPYVNSFANAVARHVADSLDVAHTIAERSDVGTMAIGATFAAATFNMARRASRAARATATVPATVPDADADADAATVTDADVPATA